MGFCEWFQFIQYELEHSLLALPICTVIGRNIQQRELIKFPISKKKKNKNGVHTKDTDK